MSDRELIGQMVMIGFSGQSDMDKDAISLMQQYDIGNVILFGWNTRTFAQTEKLTEKIRSHNATDIPLMIGIDIEGGSVTRFKGQWKPFISSAKKLGQANDTERVFEQYKRIGEQLREIGINIDLAPVMDIAPHPSATFLGNRMFGSDPDKVAPLIGEAVKGLHAGGIASMGKHFPGHGNTAADSHNTLPVLGATLEEMETYELVPFQAAIDDGLDAMLVAHLSYPNVDSSITSVSPAIITDLLRDRMGFEGVVFSDDMRMKGIRNEYSVGEAAVLHILAGGDVVLIGMHDSLQSEVLESLYQAVQDGRLTRERLEESVRRILKMKQKYNEGFAVS
jgi:beta-N-acetylhexosaminidase